METFEKCKTIRNIIINRAAEVMAYQNWSDDFAAKQIKKLPDELAEREKTSHLFGIDPSDLTVEQMQDLGFGRWSDESGMMLIPLWLKPFLMDEIETECIDGTKSKMKTADMDDDNRFGCLAYGVLPKAG